MPSGERPARRRDAARPVPLGLAGCLVAFSFTVVAMSGGPLSVFGKITVASVSFTTIVAALAGVLSWTVVLLYRRVPRAAARVAASFSAFLLWVSGSLMINGATRQGLQFTFVQLAFLGAILISATARIVVGGHLDIVVSRCFRVTAIVLVAVSLLGATDPGLKISTRPSAIVSLTCVAWFLAEYSLGKHSALWWSLASLAGIGISLSRAALFAGFVLVVATMLLGAGRFRARNVLVCVLLVFASYWAVTSWAPLRDRFVQGDVSLSVGGFKVNAEGRTMVWSALWSDIQGQPIAGLGPGAASARSVGLDPAFDHPHNDYLRIVYDFGIVGAGLLAWFVVRSARLLRAARKRSKNSVPPLAALNAGLAVLIVMATDNPLDYPFVMIPLGALIGLGLSATSRGRRRPAGDGDEVVLQTEF